MVCLVGVLPDSLAQCPGLLAALEAGDVRAAAPAGKAVTIGGRAFQGNDDAVDAGNRCQDAVPANAP